MGGIDHLILFNTFSNSYCYTYLFAFELISVNGTVQNDAQLSIVGHPLPTIPDMMIAITDKQTTSNEAFNCHTHPTISDQPKAYEKPHLKFLLWPEF